jgi:hypothetical protein
MDVLQFTLRWFYWFAEQCKHLQCIVQPFLSFLEAVLEQHFRSGATRAVIQLRGVDCDGILDFFE